MSYIESINRALEFIEQNLRSPIRVEDIAAAAHYSKFHFQRLFSIVTGDTAGSYLRKRRLTEAARQLVHSERPIIDIALEFQFQSQESFSRSFKDLFGNTPHQHRKQNDRGFLQGYCHYLEPRTVDQVYTAVSKEPEIVSREIIPLIGLFYFGQNQEEIRGIWRNLKNKEKTVEAIADPGRCYGMVHYGDDFFKSRNFSYLAGFELRGGSTPTVDHIPFEFALKVLPAAKYAVFNHFGTIEKIPRSYEYIYGNWFSRSELDPVAPFDFEFYDHPIGSQDPKSVMLKIFIPVELTP